MFSFPSSSLAFLLQGPFAEVILWKGPAWAPLLATRPAGFLADMGSVFQDEILDVFATNTRNVSLQMAPPTTCVLEAG